MGSIEKEGDLLSRNMMLGKYNDYRFNNSKHRDYFIEAMGLDLCALQDG